MERNEFKRNGTYSVFYRNKTERIQNGMERNGTISKEWNGTEQNET